MAKEEKSEAKTENVSDAKAQQEEAEGAAMMEKLLNAMKNGEMPSVETPSVEATLAEKEKEFTDKLLRQQAEFDNYRKRVEKEKQEYTIYANANLISNILPVIDHFELALKHNKDKGVQMIYDELNEILEKQGVKIVKSEGVFNPKIHEAVVTVAGDKDGMILEEIQKGYLLSEKLLRASKVKISKVMEKK
jgi:molecular chaperone GrpE